MRRDTLLLVGMVLGLLTTGCAHYEYDLVRPQEHQGHIGKQQDLTFSMEPLQYRLRTVSDHLVMRIYNATNEPVELLGSESTVVDPSGQSHPLRPQTIAAGSFIKLVFPPIRPTIERTGPTIGFGVSAWRGYGYRRYYGFPEEYYYDEPRYYTVVDDAEMYWDWRGETDVRLTLVFRRNDKTFRDEFVFHRVKM